VMFQRPTLAWLEAMSSDGAVSIVFFCKIRYQQKLSPYFNVYYFFLRQWIQGYLHQRYLPSNCCWTQQCLHVHLWKIDLLGKIKKTDNESTHPTLKGPI
jgi:hypothetical protein